MGGGKTRRPGDARWNVRRAGSAFMARISASDRRAAFVAATVRLIAREGLAATSTRAIAAEAEMPLSSLHYVFDTREQLIELAVRTIAADFRMRLDVEAIDFATVATAVHTAFGQRLEYAKSHPTMTLAAYECMTYAARTDVLASLGTSRWSEDMLFIRFLLEMLRLRQRVRFTIESEKLAAMVLTIVEGIIFSWTKTRDDDNAWLGVDAIVTVVESCVEPLDDDEEPESELLGSDMLEQLFSQNDEWAAAAAHLEGEPTE